MTFDCVWPLSQGSGWCSFAVRIRERKVPFHFRPPGQQTCPAGGYTLDTLGTGSFNVLSFWFRPGLKTWRSIFVACVFDPGSLCGSDREQTKIRTITLWYLLSVASACGAANYPDSSGCLLEKSRLGPKTRTRGLGSKHRLSKW